ncbi:MAG: hypothetical protein K2H45_03000 [Acetatifactor sp.]|nr:hypothetical protein [Acetatifactor sp.]
MTHRRAYVIFSLIMWIFFLTALPGRQLAQEGNIIWTVAYVGKLLLVSVSLGIACGTGLTWLFVGIQPCWERLGGDSVKRRAKHPVRCFLVSWLLIAAAWLPAWLAYYPGICSYDITIQAEQMLSHEYIEHHPLAHTLLVEGFLRLGERMGDANIGMGLYTLLQLLVLAAALAYGISLLYYMGKRYLWLVLLQLLGMFFPFNWYLAVSATKDILFTAFFLMLLFTLYRILAQSIDSLRPNIWDLVYVVSGTMMILFRNNGKYAFLVLLGSSLLTALFCRRNKRLYRRFFLASLCSLILGLTLLRGLSGATGAVSGDKREMLSIPIQQLARTMIYHGGVGVLPEDDGSMEEADRALIDDFILDRAYENYRPEIADPVKSHTYTHVFRYRTKEFLTTYLHLLGQFPGDYINAVLAVDAGYLYPYDVSHADINVNGRDRGLGYVQTRWVEAELLQLGVYKDSKWEGLHEALENWADGNAYLRISLLRHVLMPGGYLWFWLLYSGYLLWKKQYRALLPLALVAGYFGTLLLGPTVQLRYLYPVMTALAYALPMGKELGMQQGKEKSLEKYRK